MAARTYAVANRDPYLNDNQWDQVYRGYAFEQKYPGIGQAAEQTTEQGAGLVLRYQGAVISSFFSSSSGGYTTEWDQGEYAYLPAKADPYSLRAPTDNPGYAWTFTISAAELSEVVDGMSDVDGHLVHVGTVSRVEVLSRDTADPQSHAATLRLTGDKGAAVVGASAFRRLFGYSQMRSTLILEITSPGGPPPLPGEFTDVPPQHMYYSQIEQVTDAGLMNGYPSGAFKPETAVSRWQFAKMAVGLHNALFPGDQIPLVDVPVRPFADMPAQPGTLGDESDWVAAAFTAGLVNGVTATTFQPYEPVRRDQMATMLVRAMGWEDEAAALPAGTPGFADVPVSNIHHAAATYLKSVDVLKGYAGPNGSVELRPAEPIKRMHVGCDPLPTPGRDPVELLEILVQPAAGILTFMRRLSSNASLRSHTNHRQLTVGSRLLGRDRVRQDGSWLPRPWRWPARRCTSGAPSSWGVSPSTLWPTRRAPPCT